MKIIDVRVEPRQWQIEAANAQHRWSGRQGRLLVLTDDTGHRGFGEASPLPGYGHDAVAEVDRDLLGLRDCFREPLASADSLGADLRARLEFVRSASARFAVETAAWDLLGQRVKRPLALVWGARADARVGTATLIDLQRPDAWPARPPAALKAKLGVGPWSIERAAIERVSKQYPDVPVRLDPNRSWTVEILDSRLEDLAALADRGLTLDFVEEPSSTAWPIGDRIPLALDESLQGGDMTPAQKPSNVVAAVLKPTVLGGFEALHPWRASDATAVVSHAFEGPVAHAAASAWALAFGTDTVAGLGPHPGLDAWPDLKPGHIEGRTLRVPDAPGLGLIPRPT